MSAMGNKPNKRKIDEAGRRHHGKAGQAYKKATIYDVATAAGVSTSTVSRFLNGKVRLSKEKERAIEEAVARLGYIPNSIAQSLQSQSTKTMAIVVGDIGNPFYSQIVKGAVDIGRDAGYTTIICTINDTSTIERDELEMLYRKHVDGIILAPTGKNNDLVSSMLTSGVRVVQIDRLFPQIPASAVVVNNEEATYEATKLLIENGHTHIGVVMWESGDAIITTMQERLAGYYRALTEQGLSHFVLEIPRFPPAKANKQEKETYIEKHLIAWLDAEFGLTAVLPFNNDLGLNTLFAIRKLGRKIPGDLSVIAFDDLDLYELMTPRIAAISQPASDIGKIAADMLIRQIESDSEFPIEVRTQRTSLNTRDCESILSI